MMIRHIIELKCLLDGVYWKNINGQLQDLWLKMSKWPFAYRYECECHSDLDHILKEKSIKYS